MTLTPFEVYLVLQLDHFRTVLFASLGIGLVGTCLLFTDWHIEQKPPRYGLPIALLCLLALMALVGALLPSSRNAAAVLLLPPIVNSKFVQQDLPTESAELYGLLKDCLRELARPAPETRQERR